MLKGKDNKLIIFAAVTAIIVIAAVLVSHKKVPTAQKEPEFGRFLKELQGNVDKVGAVVFKQQGHQLKVKMVNGTWVLPGKFDYPVEVEKIRDIVVNAEKLEIVEKKTSEKDRLVDLGLGDPESPTAKNPRVVFLDATEDKIFADFIRGNEQTSGKVNTTTGLYVRNSNEDQALLVRGDFTIKLDANTLLNKKVYSLDDKRVSKASFKRLQGKSFELVRAPGQSDFKITPAKTAKDGNALNDLGNLLTKSLTFADVMPRAIKSFDKKATDDVKYETFDGLVVVLRTLTDQDGKWVTIDASATNDAKKVEAEAINSAAKNWVYRLSPEAESMVLKDWDNL
ncbi:MAG: hypothetical protein K0R98_552 [Rickettsiaceae bacterium]|jgi:hypothetical protein|nr:hypothetical protein [Rickettsiaceae bacterium]